MNDGTTDRLIATSSAVTANVPVVASLAKMGTFASNTVCAQFANINANENEYGFLHNNGMSVFMAGVNCFITSTTEDVVLEAKGSTRAISNKIAGVEKVRIKSTSVSSTVPIISGTNTSDVLLLQSTRDFIARGSQSSGNIPKFGTQGVGVQGYFVGDRVNGTYTSPSGLLSGDLIVSFLGLGYCGTGPSGDHCSEMRYFADEDWSATQKGSRIEWSIIPTGTIAQTVMMRLNTGGLWVDKNIRQKSVSLQDGWASLSNQDGMYSVLRNASLTDSYLEACVWVDGVGMATVNASSGKQVRLKVNNDIKLDVDVNLVSTPVAFSSLAIRVNESVVPTTVTTAISFELIPGRTNLLTSAGGFTATIGTTLMAIGDESYLSLKSTGGTFSISYTDSFGLTATRNVCSSTRDFILRFTGSGLQVIG